MENDLKPYIPTGYWLKLVIIFFLGWIVIYAGRSVLSPLVGELQTQFGLTKAATGGIMSLFFLAYTLFQIPSGILGDKIGRKRVLVTGFSLYAIFIAAIYICAFLYNLLNPLDVNGCRARMLLWTSICVIV